MKVATVDVKKHNDFEMVQRAYRDYAVKPNKKTLIYFLYANLGYALSSTKLDFIKLNLLKLPMMTSGLYIDGGIYLNYRLLKKAKNPHRLLECLSTINHELGHAIIHCANDNIINKKLNYHIKKEFCVGKILKILKSVTDLEMAWTITNCFYSQNSNEKYARKIAYTLTKRQLEALGLTTRYPLEPYEELEKKYLDNFAKNYKSMCLDKKTVMQCFIKFQNNMLNKGLENLNEEELDLLITSFFVCKPNQTFKLFTKQMVSCKDLKILEAIVNSDLQYTMKTPYELAR